MALRKPFEIPLHEVQRRMAQENPWWVAGAGVDPERQTWPKRAYFGGFFRLVRQLEVSRAVVLIGPRRVGKTVMLTQAVQALLNEGVAGIDILQLSLDTPLYSGRTLESLVQTFTELHRHTPDHRLWVFFDEIQYVPDWEIHLKSLVDSFRHIRFVASGSAAAALRMKSRESGAGRFTDFMLPPLTFAEYLQFSGREEALIVETAGAGTLPEYRARSIEELNREFVNYLNFGGFPEAVMNPAVRANPARFLREDIVEKVLLKDLPSLYGIRDTQELNRFFNVLAYNTGDEVSPANLIQNTGIERKALMEYLEYLEASFLIKRMHRLDDNARRMKRASAFKVYLTNPSICAALFGTIDAHDPAIGSLAETAVFSQWLHSTRTIQSLHYARWKQGRSDLEVDLVSLDPRTQKPRFAVEIKWSDKSFKDWRLLRGIRALAAEHKLARPPVVTTLTASGMREEDGIQLEFIPTSLHCYTIAKNVLRMEAE